MDARGGCDESADSRSTGATSTIWLVVPATAQRTHLLKTRVLTCALKFLQFLYCCPSSPSGPVRQPGSQLMHYGRPKPASEPRPASGSSPSAASGGAKWLPERVSLFARCQLAHLAARLFVCLFVWPAIRTVLSLLSDPFGPHSGAQEAIVRQVLAVRVGRPGGPSDMDEEGNASIGQICSERRRGPAAKQIESRCWAFSQLRYKRVVHKSGSTRRPDSHANSRSQNSSEPSRMPIADKSTNKSFRFVCIEDLVLQITGLDLGQSQTSGCYSPIEKSLSIDPDSIFCFDTERLFARSCPILVVLIEKVSGKQASC